MRGYMDGAATVICSAALANAKPKSPSTCPSTTKPEDIVNGMKDTNVKINATDAEG